MWALSRKDVSKDRVIVGVLPPHCKDVWGHQRLEGEKSPSPGSCRGHGAWPSCGILLGSWATEDAGAKCPGWGFYTYGGPLLLGFLTKAEPLEEIFNHEFITGIWPSWLEKLSKESARVFLGLVQDLEFCRGGIEKKAGWRERCEDRLKSARWVP